MGDDLLDDYWVEEIVADDDNVESKQTTNEKPSKQKKKKDKKKKVTSENVEPSDDGKTNIPDDGEMGEKKPKKKKLKRKTVDATTATEVMEPASKKKKKKKPGKGNTEYEPTVEAMWTFFQAELKKSLSDIEVDDIKPKNDEWCLTEIEPATTRTDVSNLSPYLKKLIPTWEQDCGVLTKSGTKGSPVMLIITSSAVRAVDMLRHTAPFKGESCKTAKLFAKHFKLEEQSKSLGEKLSHLAVGTPHRVIALIENGSLKLDRLKYVVVDWSWRDVKMRGLTNMPMVKESFVELFHHHLFARCCDGNLSVALF